LDRLLEGGFLGGEVVEVCGASLSGKSQFCMQMAVRTALRGYSCAYFDLVGHYSEERVDELLEAFDRQVGSWTKFSLLVFNRSNFNIRYLRI
jgi:RecA/RadA recombinase